MIEIMTPETMILTFSTIRWGGRIQLSIGMVAYLNFAQPSVESLLPASALSTFRKGTSWLRHLESPLPESGSQCAVFGLAYLPANAALAMDGTWKVSALVGARRVSASMQKKVANAACSLKTNETEVAGIGMVGPIRLSMKPSKRHSRSGVDTEMIGNESVTVHHMHAQHAVLNGKLPGLRARCFVKMRVGPHDAIRKLDSTLEKVWLFPNTQTAVLRYRALMPLDTVGGEFDIQSLAAGWDLIDAPNAPALFYLNILNAPHDAVRKQGDERTVPPDWVNSRCWDGSGGRKLSRGGEPRYLSTAASSQRQASKQAEGLWLE